MVAYPQSDADADPGDQGQREGFLQRQGSDRLGGDPKLWSVQDGEIVGKSPGIRKTIPQEPDGREDFRLTLKVKLVPNKENSGVQFRSEALPDGEMKGPQAESAPAGGASSTRRAAADHLRSKSGEKVVKVDDWNEYVIIAKGSTSRRISTANYAWIWTTRRLSRRGIFGLQIHGGGPMEVRFKDIKLEVLTPEPK